MATTFYQAVDHAITTLAASYVAGSGTITFSDGSVFGTPTASSKVPVTLYTGPDDPTSWTLYTVLEISAITGNVGTVVGPVPGYSDANAPSGAKARNLVAAKYINDLNTAVVNLQQVVFTQNSPSSTWTITHDLGRYPAVSVVDSGGSVVAGAVTYVSNNQVIINFSSGFAGIAYLS